MPFFKSQKASLTTTPAFVHVDMDNLWAIADCYGLSVASELHDFVYQDSIPRLRRLFAEAGIQATFFIVGRDLDNRDNVGLLKTLINDRHQFANHSTNHPLNFRSLSDAKLEHEVGATEAALEAHFGRKPIGFRAPGYGVSTGLLQVLQQRGYLYDSSAMPGPYGPVFRWLDKRLRYKSGSGANVTGKTQYSYFADMLEHSLAPHWIGPALNNRMLEMPVATSPLLRLPFQAGVCLRLGRRYFDTHLAAFRRREGLPLVFLMHAADVTDFAKFPMPFFNESTFFSAPVEHKEEGISYFLRRIRETYTMDVTETWILDQTASTPSL